MINKYIPLEKRSKKLKKEFYSSRRNTWNEINPVTRVSTNKKSYDRKKLSKKFDDFFIYLNNLE